MKRWSIAVSLILTLAAAGCALPPPVQTVQTQEVRTLSDQADIGRRASLRLQLATQYLEAGQAATALDEIKNAIAIDPSVPGAYHIRALAYMNLGQHELADDSFRSALAAQPNDGDLLNNYGWFLCSQGGKPDQGMAMLRQAIDAPAVGSPAKPWTNLGVCQMRQGDLDGAEKSLTRATYIDANNPLTNLTLAQLYYKRRDYARAMSVIERVNGRGNQTAESLWLGARIARRLGDVSQQNAWSAQLQRRFPNAPEEAAFERGAWDD
ncbi:MULTISPECIES: type IV pilus biogenesis/stability protein PilW [Ralstonia solanacearum species complex]|uniref:Type 4 fimbrial biogenesis protein n=3 Tax=Ralstonia solanacearum TaxID=305 RepID=A0ABF7RDB3_RALSL|nr:type IV pilus biogenesis/stability protein PilW [Ralstonia solanacearum]ALF87984.1 tetratricopeptide repeat protein [Ralstonia solanacearum]ATI27473.1 type IV pilus biogenesis/stability protein PilW [Ralstonia solanacearum]EAP72510.1 PilF protein [Ralstonia solanacearum UW551]KEI33922.1 pilus assembly protein PilW [Ralstonia solanacearum]KFX30083.1 pilus assembly protein PilW [Ralstonia solanacearum]